MAVSTVFEIHASEDEPLFAQLQEIQKLPHWERELLTAKLMRHEADRRLEEAAGAIAVRAVEQRRQAAAAATRAARKGTRP